MNYLQLCQTARELAGIPGTGPTTVVSQVGELRRLCNWVAQAWNEIQLKHDDWAWLETDLVFDTTIGKSLYTPVTDLSLTRFGHWRDGSFSIYLKSSGKSAEVTLDHWPYDDFKNDYLFGAKSVATGQPNAVAITNAKALAFGSIPDAVYTVECQYYKSPQTLTADADIPEMPTRFHMAIVHKALIKYGMFEAANEVVQEHTQNLGAIMNRLRQDQLPGISLCGSLI